MQALIKTIFLFINKISTSILHQSSSIFSTRIIIPCSISCRKYISFIAFHPNIFYCIVIGSYFFILANFFRFIWLHGIFYIHRMGRINGDNFVMPCICFYSNIYCLSRCTIKWLSSYFSSRNTFTVVMKFYRLSILIYTIFIGTIRYCCIICRNCSFI